MKINEIILKFNLKGIIKDIKESHTGNINNTYIITTSDELREYNYIMQKINTYVFKDPYALMKNMENVTEYCYEYLKENDLDAERGTLRLIKTVDGENFYKTENGEFYRMCYYIDNTRTYDKAENAAMFYNVGLAFGSFVRMLDKYPIDTLNETIPNFHNSKMRYDNFINDINQDTCNRVKNVSQEIEFIKARKDEFNHIVNMIDNNLIPVRVTHNDTKINNVLIDKTTNQAVCVIDLDTVMPGSALYDFGDAIRSGASKTEEDDTNLKNVGIDLEYFKNFTEAYLSKTKDILTKKELENLAFSCKLITLELAMRFLNDYINGDVYFKCKYDNHNLDRARNQLALVKDMESNYDEMVSIINECINKKIKILKK